MGYKLQVGEGRCKCSKCGKIYCGARQSKKLKKKWRSPCCNAKAIDWKRAIMIDDNNGVN